MARISALRRETQAFFVPSLADASPEYAALVQKRNKLDAQRQRLEAECAALMEEITHTTIPPARRERDARVAALLGDETVLAISRPHERLSEVIREIADIKAALDVLRDQIGQARYRASEKIREDLRPSLIPSFFLK